MRKREAGRERDIKSTPAGGSGIGEGTFCMEHRVLCTNNESWNTTSKTNDVIYGD